MRVSILASGSAGNCALIEARGATIIIDAGIPARVVRKRLARLLRRAPRHVDGVIVTHAHGDHARHAQVLQRSFATTLYATSETAHAWDLHGAAGVTIYGRDEPFAIGGLEVRPLPVSHDAPQVSLRLDDGEHALGLATDLGVAPAAVARHLSGCRIVMLEANHDPEMLASGTYPPFLKARIASETGHLSNDQAADVLKALPPGLRDLVLMHLSEKNNHPEIALKTARRALRGRGVRIHVAHQRVPMSVGALSSGQLTLDLD